MAHRNRLRGMTNNFLQSFVSRNNDVNGYWAIGKLYRLAANNKVSSVYIDLKNDTICPNSRGFGPMMAKYKEHLNKQLAVDGRGNCCLAQIDIYLSFYKGVPALHSRTYNAGDHYLCMVELTSVFGRVYRAVHQGRCWPHDPFRESKSTRIY